MDIMKEPCIICGNVDYQFGDVAYKQHNAPYTCVIFRWDEGKKGTIRYPSVQTYARRCLTCGNVQMFIRPEGMT